MRVKIYKKGIYYLKCTAACTVILGGSWLFYQLQQSSQILRSTVGTTVLNLEQARAQYIYIDDPRFKEIVTGDRQNLYSSALERPSISYIVSKWWKSLDQLIASRLLYIARHGKKDERAKAVNVLHSLKHLKDWHYRQVAQALDVKTAVALARLPNVDQRFFLQPPYYRVERHLNDVIEKVHRMLLQLNSLCDSAHACLARFLNKEFGDSLRQEGSFFENDLTNMGLAVPTPTTRDEQLLRSCIQAIYHHSSLEGYSKDIVRAGGLEVLMLIERIFHGDIEMRILLAEILSNVSLHSEFLHDIFQSGWIGVLVGWSKEKEKRLSVPAGCALANLDIDENENVKYPRRIYLLHPLHRGRTRVKLDVVFFHGLLGGVFVTWRQRDNEGESCQLSYEDLTSATVNKLSSIVDDYPQEILRDLARRIQMREWKRIGHDYQVVLDDCPERIDRTTDGPFTCAGSDACMSNGHDKKEKSRTQCWPMDWLPRDVPYLRIIGINYQTNLSMWAPLCPIESVKCTIEERSIEYTKKLLTAGIGKRPIVWVCHSMGGLLVKKMLVEEWKKGDMHDICKNTRSIIFYSTPHQGSRVAALTQTTEMLLWPSTEVQELREESPQLLRLHDEFLRMLHEYSIEIVSFSETKPTLLTALKFPLQFVSRKSADPGVGEMFEIPQDHLNICKPGSRQSFLYQKLLSVLKCNVEVFDKKGRESEVSILNKLSSLFSG